MISWPESRSYRSSSMVEKSSSESCRWPVGRNETRRAGWQHDTVDRGSGIRGRNAGKVRAHDRRTSKEVSTRQSLQVSKWRDLVREILSCAGDSAKTCTARPDGRGGRKRARVALDDIIAAMNKNPANALGAESVRRFVEQVFEPVKYSNGDWRKATGDEAEGQLRRAILPEIGEKRCRDVQERRSPRHPAQTGGCGS